MPAYNFKKQFVPMVISGAKPTTIRAERKDKRPPKVGQTAYLFTGMRSKTSQRLGQHPIIAVQKLLMISKPIDATIVVNIYLDGVQLSPLAIKQMAALDGFAKLDDFIKFFRETHGNSFTGWHITWDPTK